MNELTLNNLLVITIILGLISTIITKKKFGTLISASIAYWFAWTFLLIAAIILINNGWIGDINEIALYYIFQLHLGAFLGFTLCTIITKVKDNSINYGRLVKSSLYLTNKVSNKMLLILFILGLIYLIDRILTVGLTTDYLSEARTKFLERQFNPISWVATHISVIVSFLVILLGVKDSKYGINIKNLSKYIIAMSPLSFAEAGRSFLLNYFILYFVSLLLCRGIIKSQSFLLNKKEWKTITLFLTLLLFIFSIMGFFRGGYGYEFNFLYTVLSWPVSSIVALPSWIEAATYSSSTHGMFTFGWLFDFFDRLGVIDLSQEKNIFDSYIYYFQDTNNPAWAIPKSIIPDIIFDFGKNAVLWIMFIISYLFQYFSLRFSAKGVFLHTIAVLAFVGSFMTIQMSPLSPGVAVTIFWAGIFSLINKKKNQVKKQTKN